MRVTRSRNSRPLVTVVCCLLVLSPAGGAMAQWRTAPFNAPEHGFRIAFPVAPTVKKTRRQTASGVTRTVRYRAKDKAFRTSLTVAAYSRGAFTAAEIAAALNISRDRQMRLLKGELVSDKDIAIDGHPGKELVIAIGPPGKPQTYRYRVRTYYVGNRQYLMSVIGSEKLVLSARSDEYFASFALIEPSGGASK